MIPRVLLAAFAAAAVLLGQTAPETRPATIPFVILHTNDTHGQIRPLPDPTGRGPERPARGGFQELVAAIDEERAKVAHSVLVDAGDWFQGTPEGTMSRGLCSVELMNAAGYDFAALGNHEFDLGPDAIVDMLNLARFRPFARNLRLKRPRDVFPDTRAAAAHDLAWHVSNLASAPPPVVTVGGVRFAFDGMLPEDTARVVAPALFEEFDVRPEIECARRIREGLDRPWSRADALVLVNHIGKDRNVLIAREVPGIDVIIGGHNHRDVLAEGVVVSKTGTLIAQAAPSTTALGIVTVEVDPVARRIVSKKARLRRIQPDPDVRVPRVAPIIERHERAVAAVMDVQVGFAETPLPRDHDLAKPSPLGSWLTQVMLDRTGAEAAVHNVTGTRAIIPAGPVRARELFQVSPFGNALVVVRLRAVDLKTLAERTALGPGGGLYIRGVNIHWTEGESGSKKVLRLSRNGRVLADDDVLQVATTDFLASGANMPTFRNALDVRPIGVTLFDATVDAARKQGTLRPPEDNPWVRE